MRDYFLFVLFANITFISFNMYRKHYLNIKINKQDISLWITTMLLIVLSLEDLPTIIYISIFGLQIIYFKNNYKNIHRRNSGTITAHTISDAIQSLPYGVLVYEEGSIHLINNLMIDLGAQIQGDLFSSPETLWEDIINHAQAIDPIISEFGNDPLVRLKDKIWRFYKIEHQKDGQIYYEIYALDTTFLYQTLLDIEKETHILKTQSKSLKLLIKDLFITHKQEEVLNYKIKIHNNMGEAILRSQKVLKDNEDIKEELKRWDILLNRLSHSFSDQLEKSTYEVLNDLIKAGEDIGCRLHIKGEYPDGKDYADTFYEIIRESMINAKKHADAKNVYVAIESADNETEILIYNDGNILEGEFELKGGLKQMKEEIEKNWGTIKFYPQDRFSIVINFPY